MNTIPNQSSIPMTVTNNNQQPTTSFEKASISPDKVSVKLSDLGKVSQEIDMTANTIDSILMSNMSDSDRKEVEQVFTKLDGIFDESKAQDSTSEHADKLMARADELMGKAFDSLSDDKKQQVLDLSARVEQLEMNIAQAEHDDTYSKQEMMVGTSSPQNNQAELVNNASSASKTGSQSGDKPLSTAALNNLSANELTKLPLSALKKLNAAQLNKLSTAQLNTLDVPQLKQLSSAARAKLNDAQLAKLGNL
ncbi:MAG: hypothetical protein ACPGR2_06935 [Psychrobium sp.]